MSTSLLTEPLSINRNGYTIQVAPTTSRTYIAVMSRRPPGARFWIGLRIGIAFGFSFTGGSELHLVQNLQLIGREREQQHAEDPRHRRALAELEIEITPLPDFVTDHLRREVWTAAGHREHGIGRFETGN